MDQNIPHILLKAGAVSINPNKLFTFASGIKSPIYCDNRRLLSFPQEREIIIHSFHKMVRYNKLKFDVIAGTATAGIPWAAWIASRLRKPMIYVRQNKKGHGKHNQIEGLLNKGDNVLVVEDLISSGMSSINTVKAIRSKKAIVSNIIAIFSYNMAKSRIAFLKNNIKAFVLCDLENLLKFASDNDIINEKEKLTVLEWRDQN